MKRFALALFISISSLAGAALPSFKYEMSCVRDTSTFQIALGLNVVIEYDGATNTCKATGGHFFEGAIAAYPLDFECEKPVPLSTEKNSPMQAWVLTSADTSPDRISKLALVMSHSTEAANGFATTSRGIIHSLSCKKW